MRLPPTPCRVCFRTCVFNQFSHFWVNWGSGSGWGVSPRPGSGLCSAPPHPRVRARRATRTQAVPTHAAQPKRVGEAAGLLRQPILALLCAASVSTSHCASTAASAPVEAPESTTRSGGSSYSARSSRIAPICHQKKTPPPGQHTVITLRGGVTDRRRTIWRSALCNSSRTASSSTTQMAASASTSTWAAPCAHGTTALTADRNQCLELQALRGTNV